MGIHTVCTISCQIKWCCIFTSWGKPFCDVLKSSSHSPTHVFMHTQSSNYPHACSVSILKPLSLHDLTDWPNHKEITCDDDDLQYVQRSNHVARQLCERQCTTGTDALLCTVLHKWVFALVPLQIAGGKERLYKECEKSGIHSQMVCPIPWNEQFWSVVFLVAPNISVPHLLATTMMICGHSLQWNWSVCCFEHVTRT